MLCQALNYMCLAILNVFRPAGCVQMLKNDHLFMEMLSLLDQYEKDIYSNWCNGLEQTCLINLNQPLIVRDNSSGLISVNFHPKVIDVLFKQT